MERQTGACPAPTDTVQGDQDGVARELFERSNDYEKARLKFECRKIINFRIHDKISVKGSITHLMGRFINF